MCIRTHLVWCFRVVILSVALLFSGLSPTLGLLYVSRLLMTRENDSTDVILD